MYWVSTWMYERHAHHAPQPSWRPDTQECSQLTKCCSAHNPHCSYQHKALICASACVQLDSKCNILNDQMFRSNSSAEYIARAAKVVTLVDLAGHERYFKTTAYGLTGHMPDYACLIVGANAGLLTAPPPAVPYMPRLHCSHVGSARVSWLLCSE